MTFLKKIGALLAKKPIENRNINLFKLNNVKNIAIFIDFDDYNLKNKRKNVQLLNNLFHKIKKKCTIIAFIGKNQTFSLDYKYNFKEINNKKFNIFGIKKKELVNYLLNEKFDLLLCNIDSFDFEKTDIIQNLNSSFNIHLTNENSSLNEFYKKELFDITFKWNRDISYTEFCNSIINFLKKINE